MFSGLATTQLFKKTIWRSKLLIFDTKLHLVIVRKMSSLAGIIVSEGNITGWVGVELFRGKTWVGAGKIG